MVGRPREFDTEQVLDAAMRAFWANGYEATSLADLMDVTGLHKGSLYQAFGDKHSLFLQSLKRYLADTRRHEMEVMQASPSPFEGIGNVAHHMIEGGDDNCPTGCLAINSMAELAPHDDEVRQIIESHIETMRGSLINAITAGQEAGQIDKNRPADLLADMLMTFMAGLATQSKGGMDKATAHQLVDAQMETLK